MKSSLTRFLFILVIATGSPAFARDIDWPVPLAEIPIRILDNRIVINARIADYQLELVLDTGASSSALFQSTKQDFADLVTERRAEIVFPALDETVSGSRLKTMPIYLGDHTYLPDRLLRIERRPPIGDRLNFRFDGVLGQDFFEQYVVEIEPKTNMLRLYTSGEKLKKKFKTILKLHMRGTAPHIRFRSKLPWEQTAVTKELLLDTGYPGAIAIWERSHFNQAARGENKKKLRAENKGIFTWANFKIGRMRFTRTPIFLAPKEPKQVQERDGLIGANILAQFHHVIDFKSERLMLQGTSFGYKRIDGYLYTLNNEAFLVKRFTESAGAVSKFILE
ncbi:MAG: hypothetical protein JKY34_00795 [Kordiimonadaceae bacterium]|nr:hypothetical protein [Kordiimonadaceae bacterium]